MFEYIEKLKPYFFSLREINDRVSLDIKIPIKWVYEEIIKDSKLSVKLQEEKTDVRLISVIGFSNNEGYSNVFNTVITIINLNKEFEEKNKLYNQKIKELEEIFKITPLDKLKSIKFETNEENKIRFDLVGKTDRDGQKRGGETQEDDDTERIEIGSDQDV